jgi:hypothetical protein
LGGYRRFVEANLTVLNWPVAPDDDLVSAIFDLIADGTGDAPVVLGDGDGTHLAWRGPFEGGVLGMYRLLDPVLGRRGLSALYASAALEVFVPPAGDVMALRGLRHVKRDDWDAWVRCAERDEHLAAQLGGRGQASAAELKRRWAGARRANRDLMARPPGDPGKLDLGLLAGCHMTLTEWYDPDGMLGEAWASFRGTSHRTDFLAPGSEGVPGQELEESLTWRVTQWERVEGDGPPPSPLASGAHSSDLINDDDWRLCAWAPMDALEVRRLLPESLGQWVARATENGVATAQWLTAQTPRFAPLASSLREQLRELKA